MSKNQLNIFFLALSIAMGIFSLYYDFGYATIVWGMAIGVYAAKIAVNRKN